MTVRIATRKSPLAKWQANHVADLLRAQEPGLEVRLHELSTRGDRILEVPLAQVGGKGLFVKEIEDALLTGDAEIAVHSMKDLPAEIAEGLIIAAVPLREDPRDALCSPRWKTLDKLPLGCPGGHLVPAPRRPAQGAAAGPPDRGGARQRADPPRQGQPGARRGGAGLRRPAPPRPRRPRHPGPLPGGDAAGGGPGGAGAGGPRRRRRRRWPALARLEHPETRQRIEAERGFLARIEGGCQVPIGGHATVSGGEVHLRALVASLDGSRIIRGERRGPVAKARALGVALAEELLGKGADVILKEAEGHAVGLGAPKKG